MRKFLIILAIFIAGIGAKSVWDVSIVNSNKRPDMDQKLVWSTLVGSWYGEAPLKGGGIRRWLLRRQEDGTFSITFETEYGETFFETNQEWGLWGVEGSYYFTITQGKSDQFLIEEFTPGNPYYQDVYEILDLNSKEMRYLAIGSGDEFYQVKVSDDFSLNKLQPATGTE